ncbi:MAG: host attachment protein [Porticoccaceae bacterium]
MATTWVLVAEQSRARIFTLATALSPLEELEDLVHPAGRLKESELVSDHAGKMPDKGQPGQHAAPSAQSARAKEVEHFAKQLCQRLEQGCNQHQFNRLVIIAAPKLLGLLRKQMNPGVSALVVAEVGKDLAKEPAEAIRNHLRETVAR